MMKFNLLLTFGVLAAVLSNARALTKEELETIQKDMLVHVKACSEKFGVSIDEIKAAKEKHDIEGMDPCLIGCVFKSTKLVNDEGMYDPDVAIEDSNKYLSSDDDKAKFKDIANDCAKVNDEDVSDGKEGCERSKLLLGCFAKHKSELMPEARRR
uniref:Odorant binding protein 26 n=1 Tax=Cnaphalocrocis medinalis TaxID=437488 RepID=A0A1P8SKA7_CNAME|nr:odorant binding protein 26 [Cnaphalocrocis medinalis]